MPPVTYRACCSSPSAPGVYYSDPEVEFTAGAGPEIPTDMEDVVPSFETAMHESGHALICHMGGVRIVMVKIGARSFVERDVSDATAMTNRQMVMLAQAGDIAARWASRHVYQPQDVEYLDSVRRVQSGCFGKCDGCLAAVFAMVQTPTTDDTAIIMTMRSIERETVDILTSRTATTAITALAERLMSDGTVDGDTAHSILSQHIAFGSYAGLDSQ